jgi:hypothetical protein
MLECFNEDFFKMVEGFVAIIIFALVGFYLLNYMSQNEQLEGIVVSIFEAVVK